MSRRSFLLSASLLISIASSMGCAHSDPLPEGPFIEATEEKAPAPEPEIEVVGVPYPQPVVGMAKPAPVTFPTEEAIEEAKREKKTTAEVLDEANEKARQAPLPEGFVRSNLVYDYMPGSLYAVWGAPNHLTMLSFMPGEEIYSFGSGDTVRWQVESTFSGSGDSRRSHLLVQPVRRGLHTTMIVTTSIGTYHFELKSYQHIYLASVSFNHPRQRLIKLEAQAQRAAKAAQTREDERAETLAVDLASVEDRYRFVVEDRRQKPSWMPQRIFHDGKKTYIDFGEQLGERETPALFLLSKSKKPRLVQYTIKGRYMIVGEVVEFAILRLGGEDGEQVGLELEKEAMR